MYTYLNNMCLQLCFLKLLYFYYIPQEDSLA